jgi:hypothetical protein
VHRFTVALRLLQSLEPAGVGARDLAECLTLQLHAMNQDEEGDPAVVQTALRICRAPLDWLARCHSKRACMASCVRSWLVVTVLETTSFSCKNASGDSTFIRYTPSWGTTFITVGAAR